MSAQIPDFPSALQPIFKTEEPNEPVELYSGPIEISYGEETVEKEAHISLNWSPSIALIAELISSIKDLKQMSTNNNMHVSFPELQISTDAFISSLTYGKSTTTMHLEPCEMRAKGTCSQLIFQVVNFTNYIGNPISSKKNSFYRGRMEFSIDNWHIILDSNPNCNELVKKLKKQGGFALTHTGLLECIDGSDFSVVDGKKVIDVFRYFLTFCRGKLVGIPLTRGLDSQANQVYEEWIASRVSSWKGVCSWFPEQDIDDISQTFGHFLKLCESPDWYDTLTYAIHWYVNANENVAAIEGSIVLSQIALERLAWTLLIVDRQVISQKGFNDIAAADKLNLLFNELKVPKDIPLSLKKLTSYCKGNNINNLPESITYFRNAIVHPPKKTKKTLVPSDIIRDAWDATLWSLELCILAILGYHGNYVSRINPEIKWVGQTERVPWADTANDE